MGGETKPMMAHEQLPQRSSRPVGKLLHDKYRSRLEEFTNNGQYSSQNLRSRFYDGKASGEEYVKLSVYSPPDLTRPSFKEATSHEFEGTHVGASFGPSWSTHWFAIELRVPSSLQKHPHLAFHWDADNEGLVWTEDGEPVQGLTGGDERIEWLLPHGFKDGKSHKIYIEMACNRMFGNAPAGYEPPDPNVYYILHKAEIVAINLEARKLWIDFWILGDAAREFPEDSWEEHKALMLGNKIMDTFEVARGSQESIEKSREIASGYLGDTNSSAVYQSKTSPLVYAIGHCHIDTCWLWPWAETKRKIARSWSNQCDLLDRYPEHRFTCSQAQQYKWLEQYYPKLFDRVKVKVKEGKFQPIGGSWVEHDTNMPSGESLVRQFLYGQRYFESRFGSRCRTFWLPDTFGYSSQIPQVTRLAGMSRFFTQKLSWNDINNFPHTTFRWVGLDNSQVLCHMPPAETYTAEAHFGDVKRSVTQHKSMDQDPSSLLVFGKGDGGGGPTWEHLEKLRRCRGLSDKTGLLPRVHMGDSVDDFYDRLEEAARSGTEFTTWFGELYLEKHRGTYTTQANNKRNNRKAEVLMQGLEYLATMATLKDSKYQYPKKDFDDMWEGILLCQFHDCLPGSSIEMCYRDSDELYAKVFKTGEEIARKALATLGLAQEGTAASRPAFVNTLPWSRAEILKVARSVDGNTQNYILAKGEGTILGVEQFSTKTARPVCARYDADNGAHFLSNSLLTVKIVKGTIVSLYDHTADREVIPVGQKANQFVIFDDKPLEWQAWDINAYHLDTRQELSTIRCTITESGPYKACVVTETQISDRSWIKTTISLAAAINDHPSFVELECEVEWHEDWKFLKVEFPVDVLSREASYETQYGIVKRPTHYNTTWEMAKFEVCSHRFADLSENGYGVSILNDSKYGFAVAGNLMRLSLLRAPKQPDGHADMGEYNP